MQRTVLAGTAGWTMIVFSAVGVAWAGGELGPRVPGFERFHAEGERDSAGGRLLLGELNCTACHVADTTLAAWIDPKPAPVLDAVALRVRPEYLRRFLNDPSSIDAGTTMPHLLAGMNPEERGEQVEALVHFLASGGSVPELRSDPSAARRGDQLFHTIGCAVCHGERRNGVAEPATTVPLPDLGRKYSIASLAEFLREPHAVRPGGRMPSLGLDEKQSLDIAHSLIPDAKPRPKDPRLKYRVYEGGYENLPDFTELAPVSEGVADDFDIFVAGKDANFTIVFEGFLKIDRAGEYWFLLGSDDGSRLLIGEEVVSDNDGVHAMMTVRGAKRLEPGVYPIRVEYAQVAGEQKLSVQYEGPDIAKQSAINAIFLTAEATRVTPPAADEAEQEVVFRLDSALAAKGREIFESLGCANCHRGKAAVEPARVGPPLAQLAAGAAARRGCLAKRPSVPAVSYGLTAPQREALRDACGQFSISLAKNPFGPPSADERIDSAMVRFNCYGCHERSGKGGVEPERNDVFTTTVPEMGDEGRIPPHLNGVGDKLSLEWMRHLLGGGSEERPYMRTRMPNFGAENVGFLADLFAVLDARSQATLPEVDLPKHRVDSVGRLLVGESALSCIKCHNFGEHAGTGIQAIDLQTMSRRLRRDWFVRYMLDPQQYRPGTRMPSSFPKGKSAVRDVLEGRADLQLAAIWSWLELGRRAPIPAGTVASAIELIPTDRPIVYRGFLEGLSPRGIAVGYPEKANLAFDAEDLSLALIWHGAFIDASKHWAGRGSGDQRPLGDHVLSLVRGVPLAVLAGDSAAWPSATAKEQGWRFRGYRLDEAGRPHFRYGTDTFTVDDAPQPIDAASAGTSDAVFHRVLTISAPKGASLPSGLSLRAAAGPKIEVLGGRSFRIDDALTVRLSPHPGDPEPVVRELEGRFELLVPVRAGERAVIEIDYEW